MDPGLLVLASLPDPVVPVIPNLLDLSGHLLIQLCFHKYEEKMLPTIINPCSP